MSLVLVSSKRFVDHVTPVGHPERPERAEVLTAVADVVQASSGGEVVEPRRRPMRISLRVHTQEHIDAIVATRGKATMIDEDTFTSPDSDEIARLAAGAVLTGCRSRAGWAEEIASARAGAAAGPSRRSRSRDGLLPL